MQLEWFFQPTLTRKEDNFTEKKIIEDLADVQTVNNVINNIDLSAVSVNNDIDSSGYMNSIDSSVNSTNSDIQYIADVSLVSENC